MRPSNLKITVTLAILLPLAAPGGSGGQPPPRAEDFFKWGEYDSLIAVLAPWAAGRPEVGPVDSAAAARNLVRLGVAYYASGRADRADSLFLRGFKLGGDIKADSFYVTEEIAARFESVTAAARNKDSIAAVTQRPVVGASQAKPPSAARPGSRGGQGWIEWGAGTVAALAVVGGVYYLTASAPVHKTTESIVNVK